MHTEGGSADNQPISIKAECSRCGASRNCGLRGRYLESGEDGQGYYHWRTDWRILQCLGCDQVFAQTVHISSEDYDTYYEEDGSTGTTYTEMVHYWPALAKRKRPEWLSQLCLVEITFSLRQSLEEVYSALNIDLQVLSAIGMRTSFDVASEAPGIDPDISFVEKLGELVSRGHIGAVDKSRVEALVDAGSASIHRGWRPTLDDLSVMMDVLEHFVHRAFVEPLVRMELDGKSKIIRDKVPQRKRAKTTRTSVAKLS